MADAGGNGGGVFVQHNATTCYSGNGISKKRVSRTQVATTAAPATTSYVGDSRRRVRPPPTGSIVGRRKEHSRVQVHCWPQYQSGVHPRLLEHVGDEVATTAAPATTTTAKHNNNHMHRRPQR